eukprot:TRINITY_DN24913_c0_g1_i1.p1 TRINITY_DN24913_c0_g1~~TRINITY_DN24913_c0_g1_i1.p1  ORF type:complete len:657 (+),score=204.20 TRINITY_DN24913_c0_g1_i1:44-1972(+)
MAAHRSSARHSCPKKAAALAACAAVAVCLEQLASAPAQDAAATAAPGTDPPSRSTPSPPVSQQDLPPVLQGLPAKHAALLKELNAATVKRMHRWNSDSAGDDVGAARPHFWTVVDCQSGRTHYGHWQTVVLEHSLLQSGDPAPFTRLVTGFVDTTGPASAESAKAAAQLRRTATGADQHFVFFTPRVAAAHDDYYPAQRPIAALYWLSQAPVRERVLVAVDPDFLFVRPLVIPPVAAGVSVAALEYDYLLDPMGPRGLRGWLDVACDAGVGNTVLQQCRNATPNGTFARSYAVGVPYAIATEDWPSLLEAWLDLLPRVRAVTNGTHVDDMTALAWALAARGLRVDQIDGVMVWASSPRWMAGPEELVDPRALGGARGPPTAIHYCYPGGSELVQLRAGWDLGYGRLAADSMKDPDDLHVWEARHGRPLFEAVYWSKMRVPHGRILGCDHPLFWELPPLRWLWSHGWFSEREKRWLWHYSTTQDAFNAAAADYKRRYCRRKKRSPNLQKVFHSWWGLSWGGKEWTSVFEVGRDGTLHDGFGVRPAQWVQRTGIAGAGGAFAPFVNSTLLEPMPYRVAFTVVQPIHTRRSVAADAEETGFVSAGWTVEADARIGDWVHIRSPQRGWLPIRTAVDGVILMLKPRA